MRKDMDKVIVERPRIGGAWTRERAAPVDLEDWPAHEGLRSRHSQRKRLNENLRPLERHLARQVGRPWDMVYAEICAGIDRRNAVQQHIHEHLADFVAVSVIDIDGEPRGRDHWGRPMSLATWWAPRFYVDPRTGLLRINRLREQARRDWRAAQANRGRQTIVRRVLAPFLQLHRLEGLWYAVDLAPIPAQAGAGVFDVVLHTEITVPTRRDGGGLSNEDAATRYGRRGVYAWRRRQLSAKALRMHALVNEAR